jgi:hypothetical protein
MTMRRLYLVAFAAVIILTVTFALRQYGIKSRFLEIVGICVLIIGIGAIFSWVRLREKDGGS